jgi:hypothetical protein
MRKSILVTIIVLSFAACSKDDSAIAAPTSRTIIVYMAADNDLWDVALVDIEEMKRGYKKSGVNLIVLLDLATESPCLLRITERGEQEVAAYREINSADPATMRRLLGEIIAMYPAKSYGLILWSHGTSWLPAGVPLKSFADDSARHMDIADLAKALPQKFDFILFDACLMGAVEVAYELRRTADYIIASSTETIDTGFPYDLIIPLLAASTPDLSKVAESYFGYYQQQSGELRSATVSLISTKELEKLASATREIIAGQPFDAASFDRASVQRLDVFVEQYTFDFLDFISKAFPEADRRPLTEQLEKTVLYKAHTSRFLEQYEINTYCGLSCYIPHSGRSDLNAYYRTLQWAIDSRLFNN